MGFNRYQFGRRIFPPFFPSSNPDTAIPASTLGGGLGLIIAVIPYLIYPEYMTEIFTFGTASGAALGATLYKAGNAISRRLTRDQFQGGVQREYSRAYMFDAMADLLESVSPDHYRFLEEEIEKIGKETDRRLAPKELLERVKNTCILVGDNASFIRRLMENKVY